MQFCSLRVYLLQSVSYHKLIASEVVPDSSYYTPCPPKTSHFIVCCNFDMAASKRTKFGT